MTLEPLLGCTARYRANVSWKYIIGTQWLRTHHRNSVSEAALAERDAYWISCNARKPVTYSGTRFGYENRDRPQKPHSQREMRTGFLVKQVICCPFRVRKSRWDQRLRVAPTSSRSGLVLAQWLQRHAEAGSSWPSWPKAPNASEAALAERDAFRLQHHVRGPAHVHLASSVNLVHVHSGIVSQLSSHRRPPTSRVSGGDVMTPCIQG